MRRIGFVAAVLALGASTSGAVLAGPTDGLSKMDPSMRMRVAAGARGPATISMFVKTADVDRARAEITRLGGSVGTVSGDILTVRLPRAAVGAFAARSEVLRVEAAHRVTARLDKVLPETKANQVHSGGAGSPYKGAGVVVGVIDYGFDFSHEAFKKGAGSRVIAFWDQQATTGTKPAGYAYGAECPSAELAAGTCVLAAADTHGTHVAGIAAGGPVAGAPFVGIAPEADIAFVHLGSAPGAGDANDGLTTAICDGAAFIFKAAAAAGKPAVVNMSLGEHSGPHDGTSLADQCLDNLTGPGKIIVAAAGNEGQGSLSAAPGNAPVFVHASGTAAATANTVRFLPSVSNNTVQGELGVWFDSPSEVSIRIGVTDGVATTFTNAVTRTQPLAATTLTVGARTVGPVAAAGGELPGGARGIQVAVSDADSDKAEVEAVTWILEVTGGGRFDAFIDTTNQGGFLNTGVGAGFAVDNAMTIGFPAIASKVIAVGSYVTRNEWSPIAGGPQQQTGNDGKQVVIGALSGFSSKGPARRTTVVKQKPEITAPGEIVASALSSRGKVGDEKTLKASPNGFYVAEGTSMATPAVAGVVALMLQRNPKLNVDDVKKILAATAVAPSGETLPNTSWGAGKVDALAAVKAVPTEALPGPLPDAGPGADSGTPTPAPTPTAPPAATPAADSGGCSSTGTPSMGAAGLFSAGGALLFALAAGLRRNRRK